MRVRKVLGRSVFTAVFGIFPSLDRWVHLKAPSHNAQVHKIKRAPLGVQTREMRSSVQWR
jgi:hypothetical protein